MAILVGVKTFLEIKKSKKASNIIICDKDSENKEIKVEKEV